MSSIRVFSRITRESIRAHIITDNRLKIIDQTNVKTHRSKLESTENKEEKNNSRLMFSQKHPQTQPRNTTRLFGEFEVQNQRESYDEDCNNGANNPLVPAHPSRHVS